MITDKVKLFFIVMLGLSLAACGRKAEQKVEFETEVEYYEDDEEYEVGDDEYEVEKEAKTINCYAVDNVAIEVENKAMFMPEFRITRLNLESWHYTPNAFRMIFYMPKGFLEEGDGGVMSGYVEGEAVFRFTNGYFARVFCLGMTVDDLQYIEFRAKKKLEILEIKEDEDGEWDSDYPASAFYVLLSSEDILSVRFYIPHKGGLSNKRSKPKAIKYVPDIVFKTPTAEMILRMFDKIRELGLSTPEELPDWFDLQC